MRNAPGGGISVGAARPFGPRCLFFFFPGLLRLRKKASWREENRAGAKAHVNLAALTARLNSLLKKSARWAKSSETKIAGAEAHTDFADFIGPAKAVPLLQSPFGGVFQQAVKSCPDTSFCPQTVFSQPVLPRNASLPDGAGRGLHPGLVFCDPWRGLLPLRGLRCRLACG